MKDKDNKLRLYFFLLLFDKSAFIFYTESAIAQALETTISVRYIDFTRGRNMGARDVKTERKYI